MHFTAQYLKSDLVAAMAVGAVFSTPVVPWLSRIYGNLTLSQVGSVAVLCVLLLASAMSLSSGTHNPFIYFRF